VAQSTDGPRRSWGKGVGSVPYAGIGEKKVRFQHLVDLVQNFADAQIGVSGNRLRKSRARTVQSSFL